MAYQAWSVVFGEQPSASKWNILGTNDATFEASLFAGVAVQKFTSSGTYTPNAKMLYCIIEAWGGGGGGGNALTHATYNLYAAGGGAGGYSRKIATAADIGASKTVTIGAGGAGESASGTNVADTNTAGTTSVGTLCVANGGKNGGYTQGGVQVSAPGSGGSTSGAAGDLICQGNPGQAALYSGSVGQDLQANGGAGGATILGGAGKGAVNAAGGAAASNSGSGGAGGASYKAGSNRAGGNGGSGYVLVTEFLKI